MKKLNAKVVYVSQIRPCKRPRDTVKGTWLSDADLLRLLRMDLRCNYTQWTRGMYSQCGGRGWWKDINTGNKESCPTCKGTGLDPAKLKAAGLENLIEKEE